MVIKNLVFLILLVFSLFLLPTTFILQPSTAYAAWTETIVDSSLYTSSMSIDINSQGFASISYFSLSGLLRYAQYNGSGWLTQTVDSGMGHVGDTSLFLNSQGYACISYYDQLNEDLKYASFDGVGWSLSVVDSEGESGASNSLVLNSQGYALISYANTSATDYNLRLASFNGLGWSLQSVDSQAGAGRGLFNSIAINSQGYAQIGYRTDTPTKDLRYASWNGTGWVIQTVDSTAGYPQGTSLAVDSDGYARLSYSGSGLRYASFNGTGWVIQILDTASVSGFTSLDLDSQGNPYISYIVDIEEGTSFDLKLAFFNGTGWDIQTLVSNVALEGGQPTDTSLALLNDFTYIAFAGNSGELEMITNAPEGFVPEPGFDIFGKIILMGIPFCIFSRRKA